MPRVPKAMIPAYGQPEEKESPPAEVPELTNSERLVPYLSGHNPVHGILGEVFEEIGGKRFAKEWALENQTQFMRLFVGSAPTAAPTSGKTGELTIRIESSLNRTSLDDDNVVDVQ